MSDNGNNYDGCFMRVGGGGEKRREKGVLFLNDLFARNINIYHINDAIKH